MIKAIIFVISMMLVWLWIAFRIFLSYNQQELITQREKEMQFIMTSHNRINHENIQLKERILELQDANEALINVCSPDSCIKAIKNTKLPKLKETK